MINISVSGQKKLIKQLQQLGKATGGKILRKELRTTAKQVADLIRPMVPVDTGKLRRSLTIRVVKKKKRYTVAYRIFSRPIKGRKYYAFAAEYGRRKYAPFQGVPYMKAGIEHANSLIPETLKRISEAIKAEW